MSSKILQPTDVYLFWDGPLSQWHRATFLDELGQTYNCCEQYMMHRKAMLFGDPLAANMILKASTPKEQKAIGRQIRNFNEKLWCKHRFSIVWQGNFLSFQDNPDRKRFLLSTEKKLIVEASPFDAIWGAGIGSDHPDIYTPENWPGLNLLGEVMMSLRHVFHVGRL
jgi:ribA/ribD-fused uncharacterized protein